MARRFRALGLATLVAVYFLILVGGIVRASGAGMGCPDWPKCFDRWVPPTSESQLRPDYQQIYAERGYRDTRFNVLKTWTEYINRLIGVSVGILIFFTLVSSWGFRGFSPAVPVACLGAFLMVGIEGWLGSILIETNLAGWSVTVHMFGALVVVAFLVYALVRARYLTHWSSGLVATTRLGPLFVVVVFLSLIQVGLGTQVRGQIDALAADLSLDRWTADPGLLFLIHRSFSVLVLVANVLLYQRIRSATLASGELLGAARILVGFVVVEVAVGAGLFYFEIPPILQPVHLLVAVVVAGIQFGMWMMFRFERDGVGRG